MLLSIRIEIGAHPGATQVKKCTSLAPSMKRNGVCVRSADGHQDRMSDNCRYVLLNKFQITKIKSQITKIRNNYLVWEALL